MEITTAEVERIAQLARIKLADAEKNTVAEKLAAILEHFSQIQEIDTASVPMTDNAAGLQNVTRPDIPEPNVLAAPATLLEAAPATSRGHIKVTAVFD